MFKVNDVLVYGSQGVCKIVDIEEKSISGAKKKYYVQIRTFKKVGNSSYFSDWSTVKKVKTK